MFQWHYHGLKDKIAVLVVFRYYEVHEAFFREVLKVFEEGCLAITTLASSSSPVEMYFKHFQHFFFRLNFELKTLESCKVKIYLKVQLEPNFLHYQLECVI